MAKFEKKPLYFLRVSTFDLLLNPRFLIHYFPHLKSTGKSEKKIFGTLKCLTTFYINLRSTFSPEIFTMNDDDSLKCQILKPYSACL